MDPLYTQLSCRFIEAVDGKRDGISVAEPADLLRKCAVFGLVKILFAQYHKVGSASGDLFQLS